MSTTLATDREKEAAIIRKAPKHCSVFGPCECPPRSPETGWADEKYREKCPKCKGKGKHPIALKPHPACVDAAIHCGQCKGLLVVHKTTSAIQASGRVAVTSKPVDYWLCIKCRRHYDQTGIRAKVFAAYVGDRSSPRSPANLYHFLRMRGKVMFRLGLKESAIAKE